MSDAARVAIRALHTFTCQSKTVGQVHKAQTTGEFITQNN